MIKPLYPTLGVHVVNVSVKITNADGSVHYETLFDPTERRFDFTMFNLIYKDGLKQLLKELDKDESFTDAKKCLGFSRAGRIGKLSLNQLYDFFKLLGVRYVNIMDYTCRSCAIDVNQHISGHIFKIEQENTAVKHGVFGGNKSRSTYKRSTYKRSTYKRSTYKRSTYKRSTYKRSTYKRR
jgi:hypothetical protein